LAGEPNLIHEDAIMLIRRLGFLLTVVLLVFAFAWQAQAQEGENLLVNGDFEGEYPRPEGDLFRVAEGWNAWYLDAADDCHDGQPTFEPSIDIEIRNHSGSQAQQIGIRGATFTGGVFQVVEGVEPDQNYEFSVWGHVLYANDVSALESLGPDPRMKIGIDSAGGTNPYADTVRWSEVNWEFDQHFLFSVVGKATGSELTVFTYSTQPECLGSNFTFWDDAQLVLSTLPETSAEIPGNPTDRFRAASGDIVIAAASESEPEEAPEAAPAEPVVETGGTGSVCLLLYEDDDANGIRGVQEAKLSGGTFTMTDGSQVVGTYTTDGASEPYCFSNLAPGNYMLAWQAEGYEATSTQGWAITLDPGETLSHEFGATEASQDGQKGGTTSRLLRSLAIAGGVVIFLLLVGVVVIVVVLRQRKNGEDHDDSEPPPPAPPDDDDDDHITLLGTATQIPRN
jgi:hypothetical protein